MEFLGTVGNNDGEEEYLRSSFLLLQRVRGQSRLYPRLPSLLPAIDSASSQNQQSTPKPVDASQGAGDSWNGTEPGPCFSTTRETVL